MINKNDIKDNNPIHKRTAQQRIDDTRLALRMRSEGYQLKEIASKINENYRLNNIDIELSNVQIFKDLQFNDKEFSRSYLMRDKELLISQSIQDKKNRIAKLEVEYERSKKENELITKQKGTNKKFGDWTTDIEVQAREVTGNPKYLELISKYEADIDRLLNIIPAPIKINSDNNTSNVQQNIIIELPSNNKRANVPTQVNQIKQVTPPPGNDSIINNTIDITDDLILSKQEQYIVDKKYSVDESLDSNDEYI